MTDGIGDEGKDGTRWVRRARMAGRSLRGMEWDGTPWVIISWMLGGNSLGAWRGGEGMRRTRGFAIAGEEDGDLIT